MNRGADSQKSSLGGYTIVEVLIFLAVSAMLFVSTMLLLSGRQQRAQFVNAVRDFESRLTDVANDVSNGYYQVGSTDFNCSYGPSFSSGTAGQGEHKACIYLGRLVKLGEGSFGKEGYGVYSIVGNRTESPAASSRNVENLGDANPTLFWTGNATVDDSLREQKQFGYGTKVACVGVGGGVSGCTPGNSNGGIAFIARVTGVPAQYDTGSGIRAELHVFNMSISQTNPTTFGSAVDATSKTESAVICLQSGTTDQYALVFLGSAGGSGLTIKSEIRGGDSCGAS